MVWLAREAARLRRAAGRSRLPQDATGGGRSPKIVDRFVKPRPATTGHSMVGAHRRSRPRGPAAGGGTFAPKVTCPRGPASGPQKALTVSSNPGRRRQAIVWLARKARPRPSQPQATARHSRPQRPPRSRPAAARPRSHGAAWAGFKRAPAAPKSVDRWVKRGPASGRRGAHAAPTSGGSEAHCLNSFKIV